MKWREHFLKFSILIVILNSYVPSCQQHLNTYATFLLPLPKNRLCRTNTSPHGQPRVEGTPKKRYWPQFRGLITLLWGPFNPGLAMGACVGSTKSILWQWQQECRISIQVLLDDGNRIIIPQGNFKFSVIIWCLANVNSQLSNYFPYSWRNYKKCRHLMGWKE